MPDIFAFERGVSGDVALDLLVLVANRACALPGPRRRGRRNRERGVGLGEPPLIGLDRPIGGVEFLEPFGVAPGRARLIGSGSPGRGSRLQPAQARPDVVGPAELAILAIARDIDADSACLRTTSATLVRSVASNLASSTGRPSSLAASNCAKSSGRTRLPVRDENSTGAAFHVSPGEKISAVVID